jgi:hypothetical protein
MCERPEMTRDCGLQVEDLRFTDPVPTLSVMYRAGLVPEIPEWLVPSKMCDWPLNILHAVRGPIWYSSRVMGTYRIHSGGVWSGGDPLEKALTTLQVFADLERHLVPERRAVARFGQFTALQRMVDAAVTAGKRWVACKYALRALRVTGLPGVFRARCVLVLRALLPDRLFSRWRRFGGRRVGRSLDAVRKGMHGEA